MPRGESPPKCLLTIGAARGPKYGPSGDEIRRCAFALTAPAPRQAQFGMNAPDPVDDEDNLGRLGVDIGYLAIRLKAKRRSQSWRRTTGRLHRTGSRHS